MGGKKVSILDYTEVLNGLRQMRAHPGLSDFAPLLFLFVALQIWFAVLIQIVEAGSSAVIRMGTRFDNPIPTEKLDFFRTISQSNGAEVPTAVGQTNIAAALNAANPGYIPDFLNFTAESNPALGWIFFAFVVLGYAIPGGYFLYSFLIGSIPKWCRHLLQVLVVVAGAFWICAMFANGITVKNPIQGIGSAGFWFMYGALCLHLFSDRETKFRRYLAPACLAALAFAVLVANGFSFSTVFFSQEVPFKEEVVQLNAAVLSGWWSSFHEFMRNPGGSTTWLLIIGYVTVSTTYAIFEKRITKITPFLNLAIATLAVTTLIFVVMTMLGMRIQPPSATLGTQALLLISGAFFLRYTTSKIDTEGATRQLIDNQIASTERKRKEEAAK